jgi:hypothetical protein
MEIFLLTQKNNIKEEKYYREYIKNKIYKYTKDIRKV